MHESVYIYKHKYTYCIKPSTGSFRRVSSQSNVKKLMYNENYNDSNTYTKVCYIDLS